MLNRMYTLPELNFKYTDLIPYISETQLTIHHQKHHQAYVNAANAILDRLEKARKEGLDVDMKATLKDLSFNIGGHVLHSLFWRNLSPAKDSKKDELGTDLGDMINEEFGNYERFKKEFTQAAMTVEGSGWAALTLDKRTKRLMIMQIEKHNTNIYPTFKILMILDVFEHAYYIDYKNDRGKFVEAFWNIINWKEVSERFEESLNIM